ncbi:hypothetical protein [Hymenobacter cheonanensis]|uniref:hypothetical protein n=1 Tax=Hymenobacter sp. CA2-7 TaxID=3063993 RepID=UPI00271307AF|nr:hypothetical protein [Hymenobacter sp. CA2-7]MDO7885510.1 hypothetical protein [Hymenobacter sp. CA2-7]
MGKKILAVLLLWAATLPTSCAQTKTAGAPETKKISAALKELLPAGALQVAAMDSVVMNPRLAVLLAKFQEGIRANPQYIIEMQNKAATRKPGPMPYDKRSGMSEPEFRELETLMEKREIKVAPSYTGTLQVEYTANTIHFNGTGRLSMLNEVWLDLDKNEAHFLSYILPYKKLVTVSDAKNAYDSAWTAYEWELSEPADESFESMSLEKLRAMHLLQVQFEIGTLATTGKTLLKLKAREIDKGKKKYAVDTPFFVQ